MKKTEVMVDFSIYGNNFNPNEITKIMGITPNYYWCKGDVISLQDTANKNLYKFSNWSLSTGYQESRDVDDQLNVILKIIRNKKNKLIKLATDLSLKYQFEIVVNIYNKETPGFCISKKVISFINTIGASIDVDLYVCEE